MSSTNPSVPGGGGDADQTPMDAKGQLISKCLYEKSVSSKIPTKYFWISALKFFVASWKLFGLPVGFLVYDITY